MFNGTMINPSATVIAHVGAAISGGPFTAVSFNNDGAFIPATNATVPFGILIAEEDEPLAVGDEATVQVKDIGVWKAGAAVKVGDLLACDANGKCVKATTGDFILAVALEAATAAGTCIRVQIVKSGYMK